MVYYSILTILNRIFILWLTEKLLFFYLRHCHSIIKYIIFVYFWRTILQTKAMSTSVTLISVVIGATVVMFILNPLSFEYTKFTWYIMIFIFLLNKYFKSVLIPIFYPVRRTHTEKLHIEAGYWQLRHFHSSRSLHMPFGKAGHEFAKGMQKFAFAHPWKTFGAFFIGGSIPGGQYVYNKQRAADLAHTIAVNKSMERMNREKLDTVERLGEYLQEKCTLPNAKFNPACEHLKEAVVLSFDAWKASNGF